MLTLYRPASSLPRMFVRLNDHGCARMVSNGDDQSNRLPFSTQLLRQHESTGKEHAGRQEKFTAYACCTLHEREKKKKKRVGSSS